jgi:hypothetical protein
MRRLRPSPAMVVAVAALVAAVGGTSYAALSVDSRDLEKGAVKSRHVENSSLKGNRDLKDDSVRGDQVQESTLGSVPSADTLGGETAADQKVRWLLLNEQGQIEEQSGGFTVLDAYQTNQNVYIDSGESLVGKGVTATVAIQNQVDVNGAAGADPNFAGEVSVARCQVPGVVECAPANSKTVNALVVSPRNSDGTATAAGARKRVYVQITE